MDEIKDKDSLLLKIKNAKGRIKAYKRWIVECWFLFVLNIASLIFNIYMIITRPYNVQLVSMSLIGMAMCICGSCAILKIIERWRVRVSEYLDMLSCFQERLEQEFPN